MTKKFKVEINIENDAFVGPGDIHGATAAELGRLLRHIADRLMTRTGLENTMVRDLNGNMVGYYEFKEED